MCTFSFCINPWNLWKMFFILSKIIFLSQFFNNFFSSFRLFQIQNYKWKWNNLWCYNTSWICLHKLVNVIYRITQKPFNITSSTLIRLCITNKTIFLNLFCNTNSDCSLVPGPFFDKFVYWKRLGSKEKRNLPFLRLFDNHLSKNLTFKIISCMEWLFWVIYQNYREVWD